MQLGLYLKMWATNLIIFVTMVSSYHQWYISNPNRQYNRNYAVFDVTVVEGGVETVIQVNDNESLLVSIEKYPNIQQASSCRSGSCGVCACKVNDADSVLHDDEDQLDSYKRWGQGFIFSCVARVKKAGLVVVLNQEDAYNKA